MYEIKSIKNIKYLHLILLLYFFWKNPLNAERTSQKILYIISTHLPLVSCEDFFFNKKL